MSRDHAESDPPGPRQAVVLIHGIGEQRPMDTLRAFVAALLPEDKQHANSVSSGQAETQDQQKYYSKPDTLGDSYELRRLKLRRVDVGKNAPENVNADWPETDFYEYYWAHQMYGTTVSHVVGWLIRTLARGWRLIKTPTKDDERVRKLSVVMWAVTIVTVAVLSAGTWLFISRPQARAALPVLGALGALLYLLGKVLEYLRMVLLGFVLDVIGDVARYLDVAPKNVARRYDILRGGLALLRNLHDARDERGDKVMYRYGRVILVGHSLGSVIAYDLLRHYWAEVNGRINVEHIDLKMVEGFYPAGSPPPQPPSEPYQKDFRSAQTGVWRAIAERVPSGRPLEKRRLWHDVQGGAKAPCAEAATEPPDGWRPARWLVSDLITLGSPLAHAPVLLADGIDGKDGLGNKIRLRELPTCPPDRSRHLNPGRFTVDLSAEADRFDHYPILHHAAHFAVTRWTNFWCPRDFIGGPLHSYFGPGICDERLADLSKHPVRAHTSYWTKSDGTCVKSLRAILRTSMSEGE